VHKLFPLLVTALFSASETSCIHRPRAASSLRHDADRFANTDSRYQWFELTDSQYEANSQVQGQSLLPKGHPMTSHLQIWVDHIWGEMVAVDQRLAVAPFPKVRIRKTSSVDAFVAPQTVCLKTQMVVPEMSPRGEIFGSWLVYDRQNSMAIGAISTSLPCLDGTSWAGDLGDFLTWLLGEGCGPMTRDSRVTFGPDCKAISDLRPGSYDGIITKITHNFVTVDVGLLQGMTESQVIAVLAHELAHYGMAHRTTRPDEYGYFYLIPSHNSSTKPAPIGHNDPLYSQIKDIVKTVREEPLRRFPIYQKQNLHGSVIVALSSFSNRFSENSVGFFCPQSSSECLESCKLLGRRLADLKVILADLSPRSHSQENDEILWKDLDQDIERCTKHLKAQSLAMDVSRGLMGAFAYKQDFTRDLPRDGTLWQLLKQASDKAKIVAESLDKKYADALATAHQKGVGWYTAEQEADDIATDLTTRLGLPPDTMIQMTIRLGELTKQPGTEECKARAKTGFPDFVSPGRFLDEHHDFCFRAYNSSQELRRHRSDRSQSRPISPSIQILAPAEWEKLVRTL
jgi:hypothetical protein